MLPSFDNARVLVVGDVMLDRYWFGSTSRISPEAPVPVVRVENEDARLGGAGNVAANSASLGAKTHLIGLIGEDEPGATLVSLVERLGITHDLIRVDGSRTINKLRIMSRSQQLLRLDIEDSFPARNDETLIAAFSKALPNSDVIVFSDYAKGTLKGLISRLIGLAKAAGKYVLVDPKGSSFDPYRGADLITPNMAEFEAVVGHCPDNPSVEERAHEIRSVHHIGAILVTRGEDGMTLVGSGTESLHLPTQAREVFDVTGAGDTVVATLATMLAAKASLPLSVLTANAAAGLIVGKRGTVAISIEELRQTLLIDVERRSSRKIIDRAELNRLLQECRQRGETVVMTNGCFDILHPGHVLYLEQARALGDRLIVAVNDDDSVRRLKGSSRPINTLEHRLQVLSGLTAVDALVSFGEDTPEQLYAEVLPNVLVKGGDYRPDQIAGASAVIAAGGRIQIIPFLEGYSTTSTIDKMTGRAGTEPE